MPVLPLNLRVDEVSTLPQVWTAADVRRESGACFTELLRHSAEPADLLFPGAEAHHGGEVPPPPWWSDKRAHLSDVHLFKVRDALVFPGSGVVVTDGGDVMRLTMEEAAYGAADLTHLPNVERRDGSSVLNVPEPLERMPKALVVLPSGMRNYGHFVLDGLASLAAIAGTGVFADHPVLVPPLQPWQARHFALFGAEPTVSTAPVVGVDEVVYTSCMNHFLHAPNVNYRDLRRRQMAGAGLASAPPGRRRLYLSRHSGSRRTMASERRLMARLRRAGFDVVDTGRMAVDRQMALFAEAEAVVGVTGAAFANALYCRPGTLVVEIQPAGMENHWVLALCRVMSLRHAAYFCGVLEAEAGRPERFLHFDLDVDRFLDFAFGFPPLRPARPARRADGLLGRIGRFLAGPGQAR